MKKHARHSSARALAAAMALIAFIQVRATASPGDIFSIAAPNLSADQPKAAALDAGDASVSTQTGALTYTYPIHVPPGRHGMQPSLGLTYSSQAPIYGTVASGWSIPIASIDVDTSNGRLAPGKAKTYTSSMAGGRPLIPVTEALPSGFDAAYRAQNDTTFTRYLHNTAAAYPWIAQGTDGRTYYYAQSDHNKGCTYFNDERAPLTSMVDEFGNAVDYYYAPGVTGECLISLISWGQNTSAGLAEFARVTFGYAGAATCNGVPVGAMTSYRTGTQVVTGATTLSSLVVTAYTPGSPASVVHTRQITLAYSGAGCTATSAAFRTLSSIQESAWGTDSPRVNLPAVTFTYGSATPSYVSSSPAVPWHSTWGGINIYSALSWGQRFPGTAPAWPTVEAMLIDIDGDGLLDRVTNDYRVDSTNHTVCGMSWERNPGGGAQFQTPIDKNGQSIAHIDLPTLKWASPASDPYAGGLHPNDNLNGGTDEICALNYQETAYVNSHGNVGGDLGCQPGPSACPASGYCDVQGVPSYGYDCGQKNGSTKTILAYRWIDIDDDGKVDLVASIAQGGLGEYNLEWGNGVPMHIPQPMQEPSLFGGFPPCPSPSYSDGSANTGTYTMCNGMYPWFVYKNHGAGVFGSHQGSAQLPDMILYQPVPLETTTGDSTISGRVVGNTTANVDLDGDGHNDMIESNTNTWSVFRGSASGNAFQPSAPFSVGASDNSISVSSQVVYGVSDPISTVGLFDLNGDGLVDRWTGTNGNASVELNNAYGFIQNPLVTARRPGTDGLTLVTSLAGVACTDNSGHNGFSSDCSRVDSSRTIDVDGDGRSDLVQLPGRCVANSTPCVTNSDCGVGNTCSGASTTPGVYFNQGGQFATAPVTAGVAIPLDHSIMSSSHESVGTNPYTWAVRSDMIDLDGDGILDGIATTTGNTTMTVSRMSATTTPPRLLALIDNGRGARTTVTYAPLSNSAVVTQDWQNGKVSPRSQWVVSALSTVDRIDVPATTTTSAMTYKNPVYNKDDLGHFGLRGFEESTTTGPTGAKTIDRYRYDVDWRGAHTQSLVYSTETPTSPTSIETTTWESRTLFGGVLITFHPTVADHLICAPGQAELACTAAAAAGFSRTTRTLSACRSGTCDVSSVQASDSLVWTTTQTLLQQGTVAAIGDRRASSSFNVFAPPGTLDFRVRSVSTLDEVAAGASWNVYGKKAHTWDSSFLVPLTDEVWVDTVDANRSITQRTYDMTTGNVLSRRKPNQTAASGPSMTYDYDSRKLFVATDHSEPGGYLNLSQQISYIYEYGTGTKLETIGPNIAVCSGPPPYNTPTCPANTSFMEDSRIQVDGLGRTIDRWETLVTAGGSYYLTFERERNTYVDQLTPNSVDTRTAYDFDQNTLAVKFLDNQTVVDGHGRAITKRSYAQGAAAADAIKTFTYKNAGLLTNVTVPDPTLNTTATVQYTYTFDSLGRPTSLRRPDSTTPSNQSGANLTYSGMTATSTEVVGAALGQQAITTSTKDIFGRLTKVEETVIGTTKAATTYGYDAADHVVSVVDPTGVTTAMSHDFAGQRTNITRAGATWLYTYDKNGNINTETFPGSTPSTIQNYINTTVYDDLDRPTSRSIGQRALGAADIAAFGAGYEQMLWDLGANASGRLGYVASSSPTGASVTTSQYTDDLAGHEQITTEGFSGLPSATPTVLRHQTLLGNVQDTYYGDYPAQDRATWSNIHYDARGLPSYVELSLSTSTPTLSVAQQTRNVAGLVTKRHTDVTGSPMTFTESNWTYDKLGRVTSQIVQDGPTPTQVARQDLAYFGNDDPKTLDQWLGPTNHKHFTYGYDLRHEITSVGETLLPNAFTATYAFNNGGRFTSAIETAAALPNSDVASRNVTYSYSGTDPEQVTALVNTNSTIAWAYAYDAAGNQRMRCKGQIVSGSCTGASETDYVYDGNDRLRRATQKSGATVQGSEEYWYDGHGNRNIIVKKDSAGNKTETIWFIVDTELHYDGAGNWVHSYANVSMGTPVARIDTGSGLVGKTEYQFHGLANNTLAAVDQSTGTVNASFSYAPFGEVVEATNAGGSAGVSAHRRRFNDKYVDEVSGITYYGARYYDKMSMSWTQTDPLYRFVPDAAQYQSPRRASLYQFSLENPLRYLDPDGRDSHAASKNGPVGSQCAPSPVGGCSSESAVGSGYQGGTQDNNIDDIFDRLLATAEQVDANRKALLDAVSDATSNNPYAWIRAADRAGFHRWAEASEVSLVLGQLAMLGWELGLFDGLATAIDSGSTIGGGGPSMTTLWKAPRSTIADPAAQLTDGFSAAEYPGEGPFFSLERGVAEKYQYHYQNGLQEINLPRSTYESLAKDGVFRVDPGEVNSVHVPASLLDRFNEALQAVSVSVYHPE